MAAADGAVVGLDRTELEAHAREDIRVSVVHLLVGLVHALDVLIEGVEVLHDELAAAHEAETRTALIAELVLDLVEHQRQLLVGADFVAHERRDHLFMRRSEAEVAAMAVLDAHHLVAVGAPAAALLPEFCRLQDRHHDLLAAGGVHLLADDLLDLADRAPCERQEGVHATGRLADHAGAVHELMAGDLCLSWRISKGWCIKVTCSHVCVPPISGLFPGIIRSRDRLRALCGRSRPCGRSVLRRCRQRCRRRRRAPRPGR